ncbi:helix-turn-helix domain-containing protein [Pseudoflavonifractor phocaeensis]|uniref:helix-turn-helix domain-containing protein n=1 Tax=Pseudoflavonifractor phocaeensis TaxID=1870988 RepID=UPI001F2D24FC|nr:helix-turn-helix transcriptional regulator [Pseudoflavonifractor phocaeensis]MCF2597039.1 helix-turn-helix domain-containing protein [Pseudoflavonifractor phocaeensis]
MSFSENLQFLRTRNSITQEQLAEQLDVSRQSVSKWESGASFPEMDTLLRICDLYSVDLDTLLRGSVEASQVSDTARYDDFMTRFIRRMTLAIGAIIAAVGGMPIFNVLGLPEMLIVAFLLLVITVSVVTIVASGMQYDRFCKKNPTVSDFYSQEEKDAFGQKFIWYIAGGVGGILFGVVLLLLFFNFFPEQEPYESVAAGLFLLIVAGSVMSLVYGGMTDDKYKIWKYNRDNNPTPEARARKNLIGAVCGALMTLATAIYVGLGLALNLWGSAWWVFAVGGILCGVVCIILDPYKGED